MTKAKRSVFIGVALGVAACAAAAYPSTASAGQAGRPLVYCSEGDPEGFYPPIHTTGTTFDASSRPLYDTLYVFDSDGELVPALAESVEISDDGLVYVFRLRRGVTFHTRPWFEPTREFTAEDVRFSLIRQRGGDDDAGYEYWTDFMGMDEFLDDVVVVNDYTVRMTLSEPNATLLAILTMDFTAIASAEYYQRLRATRDAEDALDEFNTRPIGTGPYQFETYIPDALIRYRSHPGYWRGSAPTETLIFAITGDATARFLQLRFGDCHVAALPSPATIDDMRAHPDIEVLEKPGLTVSYLAWHTQRPPFDNPEVRRAMDMAINKRGLLEAVYRATAIVAKSPIPPEMPFHAEDLEGHEYDPQAARQLLAAAGISGRLSTTIFYPTNIDRGYMPNFSLAAELIQRDLRAVGVDAELRGMLWNEFLSFAANPQRESGAVIFGWTADVNDPDNFLRLLTCGAIPGLNAAAWCNTEFDEIVRRARTIRDPVERAALYRRAQEIFIEEAPWVPIAHALILDPVRREVCDYEVNPFGLHDFYGVRFCEAR